MHILVGNYHYILGDVEKPPNYLIDVFTVIYGNISPAGNVMFYSFMMNKFLIYHCVYPFKCTQLTFICSRSTKETLEKV